MQNHEAGGREKVEDNIIGDEDYEDIRGQDFGRIIHLDIKVTRRIIGEN